MDLTDKIERLKRADLLRTVKDRGCPSGKTILVDGRKYLNFSSNDYLGLAAHPAIIAAAQKALDEYGHGAGASRLLSGGTSLHSLLEKKTASFKVAQKAVIFNSGYAANTGAIPAVCDETTAIMSDELNHASIVDGCRLSKATRSIYKHNDLNHLEPMLRGCPCAHKFVITETVFGMDGDIADLCGLKMLCDRYGAVVYLDDAHATGVLGNGRGGLAHFNIMPDDNIIQMGTYSKALGSVGGFVAASNSTIDYLINTARPLIYSTALPSSAAAAALAAIDYVQTHPESINKLRENIRSCRQMLRLKGFDVTLDETPIIPILFDSTDETLRISGRLHEMGVHAPAIRPPTVKTPRIRISISALHDQEDILHLVDALTEAAG